jgi:hypothetical protein
MEWRKNLYEYEAAPPEDTWGKIVMELDQDVPSIREALYDYAEEPPASSWLTILAEMDEPKTVSINKYRRPLGYVAAAAAVLAGVIFFTKMDYSGSKEFRPDISASVYKPSVPEKSTIDPPAPGTTSIQEPTGISPNTKAEPTPEIQTEQRNETRRSIASIQPVRFDPNDENYIYLTTYNGEVKRISYKFEEMIPEIKKQNSELIRKWRAKLESSSFVPAGNNFFDIAEMVKILEEEKRP